MAAAGTFKVLVLKPSYSLLGAEMNALLGHNGPPKWLRSSGSLDTSASLCNIIWCTLPAHLQRLLRLEQY